MDNSETILDLVVMHSSVLKDRIDPNNILRSTGMAGDDAEEFMLAFQKEFRVDLSDFLAYLHYNADEPPFVRTAWGVGADGRRMPEIPIRLSDLVVAAESGKWQIAYPEHKLVEKNLAGLVLMVGVLFLLVIAALFVTID